MKNNASLIYGFFLVVGDFMALVAAFVIAYILRVSLSARPLFAKVSSAQYFKIFLFLLPFWLLIFGLLGLYNKNTYENRFSEFGRLFTGSFIGMLFVISYSYIMNTTIFPARLVILYAFILAVCFIVVFRALARIIRRSLFAYGFGINTVLLVGDTKITDELIESLHDTKTSGYKILGIVSKRERLDPKDIPTFTTFDDAIEALKGKSFHSILQTELYVSPITNSAILAYAQENHIAYRFVPGNSELFVGNLEVDLFRSIPVIAVHQTALLGWGRILKRLFDIFTASIILILASPIILIVALLIKLSDGGPVFLRQIRLTRFNREFKVFKFRSHNQTYNGLTPDEAFEKMNRHDLLKQFRENGNFLAQDPRETTIGRFIRKTSLDELPQLFNVIAGDLSLVGPRALIPKDLAEYKKRHTILSVKSGITGLAQVSGRNNIPFEQRRTLDLYYVQNWSFWLDLIILIKTARAVLTHERQDKKTLS
jgi:exopolysaccharide biosynthesis polyprenyl glycosylphosphotransferase